MATVYEWMKDTEHQTDRKLKAISKALRTLRSWTLFREEYKELQNIQMIVEGTILDRLLDENKED